MPAFKDLLEGKPLRSPLHPALVHLPLALFPISAVLDVGSWVAAGGNALVRGAFACLIAGLATGVLAGVAGMVDYAAMREDHPAKKTATLHLVLNLVALGVFGAGAGLRYPALAAAATAATPFVVSLVALGLLAVSGYLGGHLVYGDGIGVGRHRRRTRMPVTTIVAAPVREPTGPRAVAVADDAAVREGETLRVEVGGVIVAIARVQGALHAFQEFCPHRYGPLSEGALEGCDVVCPWHRSRFDVRTGQVTQGPAKVDLRTFRVEKREGKIWLEIPPDAGAAR